MNNILPELIQQATLQRKETIINSSNPIRIAIVTHSKFMEENIVKRLSATNKTKILKYRNVDDKVKVFNCDVYKMTLSSTNNRKSTNLFFPKEENCIRVDWYGMPPFVGKKIFFIGNKNVAPLYMRNHPECFRYPNRNVCQEILNILIGLCNKENEGYRQFILNKISSTRNQTRRNENENENVIEIFKKRGNVVYATPRRAITGNNIRNNFEELSIQNKKKLSRIDIKF